MQDCCIIKQQRTAVANIYSAPQSYRSPTSCVSELTGEVKKIWISNRKLKLICFFVKQQRLIPSALQYDEFRNVNIWRIINGLHQNWNIQVIDPVSVPGRNSKGVRTRKILIPYFSKPIEVREIYLYPSVKGKRLNSVISTQDIE